MVPAALLSDLVRVEVEVVLLPRTRVESSMVTCESWALLIITWSSRDLVEVGSSLSVNSSLNWFVLEGLVDRVWSPALMLMFIYFPSFTRVSATWSIYM